MDESQLLQQFVKEARGPLELIEKVLLKIERDFDIEDIRHNLIHDLFRGFHGIKGISDIVGHERIIAFAHQTESLLDIFRNHSTLITQDDIQLLLYCHDILKALVKETADNKSPAANIEEKRSIFTQKIEDRIKGLAQKYNDSNQGPSTQKLKFSDGKKQDIFVKAATDHIANIRNSITSIKINQENKKILVKINRTLKLLHNSALYAGYDDFLPCIENLKKKIDQLKKSIVQKSDIKDISSLIDKIEVLLLAIDQKNSASSEEDNLLPGFDEEGLESKNHGKQEIALEPELADDLMNDISELVIVKNAFDHKLSNLDKTNSEQAKEFKDISNQLAKLTSSLQKRMLDLRMIPVSFLFGRIPRMLRDLAQNVGKKIELDMIGSDTKLESTVIENLYDPIIHLIRNAIDHGIETPETRKKKGKSAIGQITLRAHHESNQVIIEVIDDGAGLNLE